jgi:hypothetical protein
MTLSILGWMDVQTATISAAVRDASQNLVMEATLEKHGLRGSLHVSFEEGMYACWLHVLLKPHVTKVLVCDPRKNALLRVVKMHASCLNCCS